ncbi:phosphatase PAP2 family protein [Flintibacter muris]|uniref:phosphatase PAP2 family protein n=1 Tax=Flintibacter muris TaxID=2941327 RepID=UPI0020411EE5|nr:phosphatase PAP2 family protein [Flintibacter muris]
MLEGLLQMDGQLLVAIQGLHMSWLDPIVSLYTKLGDAGIFWIVLSLAMLVYKPTRKAGALALCAMVLGLLVTNLTIKPLVERARPWLDWPIVPLVTEKDPNSFPSGHTCAAFAAGMIWMRTLPWRWGRVAAVVLAALMGLSRLYVGVHYPTDVLVGAIIGALCALVIWKAYLLYADRRNQVY